MNLFNLSYLKAMQKIIFNKSVVLFFSILIISDFSLFGQENLPEVVTGKIERIPDFKSKYITSRNIDIWLPADYDKQTRYSVIYMHDGQMLFDSDITWNHQSWNIDDIISDTLFSKKLKKFILVGIWNDGKTRHSDYFPQKPFEKLSKPERDTISKKLSELSKSDVLFTPNSDNYLKFIVRELKPLIEKKYSVKSNRENTFIGGSSMGGMISLYAICEYPQIFGGAFCMSTHWPGTFYTENNPFPESFLKYLDQKLPDPGKHMIYFDCGDQTLDALYPPIQKKVDDLMIIKLFNEKNWITRYFPGENHSEIAWNKRLHIPIEFLLQQK